MKLGHYKKILTKGKWIQDSKDIQPMLASQLYLTLNVAQ